MDFWDTDIANHLTGVELKTFLNKKRIIKYLYRHGELSGMELSKILHVSAPTVNGYLNELIEEQYLEKRGKGDSIGGRKPQVYGLKKNSVYIVGIDMGRKFLRIAVLNCYLEIVSEVQYPSISFDNKQALIEVIYSITSELLSNENIPINKVMGIGINMPGLIDSDKGINYTYVYDAEEAFATSLTQKFKCPVYLENDSKVRALAEMRYGGAKNSENALVIQADWGLGLGMILNGKLYKGNSGFSGEFSHIPVEENGELCNCGKVGCLETFVSGKALVRMALEGLEDNRNSKLYGAYQEDKDNITPKLIIEKLHEGDQFALKLIQKIGFELGKGISYLIQILNPELVIIGGVISQADQYLITPIKQAIYEYCLSNLHEDTKILISPLGQKVGVMGSAIMVLENTLENN